MPIHPELLKALVCPATKLPVSMLDSNRLEKLNHLISEGAIETLGGQPVSQPLTEALITRNNQTIYRVERGIPVMLEGQAIAADQIAG